jgi:hypothetical protein
MSSADFSDTTDAAVAADGETNLSSDKATWSRAFGARPWFSDAQRAELAADSANTSRPNSDRPLVLGADGFAIQKFFPRGGEADTTADANKPKLTPIMRDHL